MALRKGEFDDPPERARPTQNYQQSAQEDRVSVEINRRLYQRVKAVASRKRLTASQYLEQLLDEMVPEIDEVARTGHASTQDGLERLRELREELFRRNNYEYFGNSVEDLRQIREERLRQLLGDDYDNE